MIFKIDSNIWQKISFTKKNKSQFNKEKNIKAMLDSSNY